MLVGCVIWRMLRSRRHRPSGPAARMGQLAPSVSPVATVAPDASLRAKTDDGEAGGGEAGGGAPPLGPPSGISSAHTADCGGVDVALSIGAGSPGLDALVAALARLEEWEEEVGYDLTAPASEREREREEEEEEEEEEIGAEAEEGRAGGQGSGGEEGEGVAVVSAALVSHAGPAALGAAPSDVGGARVPVAAVVLGLTIEGDLADFDEAKEAALLAQLAAYGGVDVSRLRVRARRAGSIVLEVEVSCEAVADAEAAACLATKIETVSIEELSRALTTPGMVVQVRSTALLSSRDVLPLLAAWNDSTPAVAPAVAPAVTPTSAPPPRVVLSAAAASGMDEASVARRRAERKEAVRSALRQEMLRRHPLASSCGEGRGPGAGPGRLRQLTKARRTEGGVLSGRRITRSAGGMSARASSEKALAPPSLVASAGAMLAAVMEGVGSWFGHHPPAASAHPRVPLRVPLPLPRVPLPLPLSSDGPLGGVEEEDTWSRVCGGGASPTDYSRVHALIDHHHEPHHTLPPASVAADGGMRPPLSPRPVHHRVIRPHLRHLIKHYSDEVDRVSRASGTRDAEGYWLPLSNPDERPFYGAELDGDHRHRLMSERRRREIALARVAEARRLRLRAMQASPAPLRSCREGGLHTRRGTKESPPPLPRAAPRLLPRRATEGDSGGAPMAPETRPRLVCVAFTALDPPRATTGQAPQRLVRVSLRRAAHPPTDHTPTASAHTAATAASVDAPSASLTRVPLGVLPRLGGAPAACATSVAAPSSAARSSTTSSARLTRTRVLERAALRQVAEDSADEQRAKPSARASTAGGGLLQWWHSWWQQGSLSASPAPAPSPTAPDADADGRVQTHAPAVAPSWVSYRRPTSDRPYPNQRSRRSAATSAADEAERKGPVRV